MFRFLYSPPYFVHAFVTIPALFFFYMLHYWPGVFLATIIPPFWWAVAIVLIMYYITAILCYTIWFATVGWTTGY